MNKTQSLRLKGDISLPFKNVPTWRQTAPDGLVRAQELVVKIERAGGRWGAVLGGDEQCA